MRALVQRVTTATVTIGDAVSAAIDGGLAVLVGFTHTDTPADAAWMATKIAGLRVFNDDQGKMNLDLAATGGAILVVSQFTLYGDASAGRRPSFVAAARPETAIPLYELFIADLRATGLTVATGTFGADMKVALTNDGPVTLMLEYPPA
ncbi:MAG TPA: D-aminoacyl-tRNA deacylase [Gemmatimonadales bacterium]